MDIHSAEVCIWIDSKAYYYDNIAYISIGRSERFISLYAVNIVDTSGNVTELLSSANLKIIKELYSNITKELNKNHSEFVSLKNALVNFNTAIYIYHSHSNMKKLTLDIFFPNTKLSLNMDNRKQTD